MAATRGSIITLHFNVLRDFCWWDFREFHFWLKLFIQSFHCEAKYPSVVENISIWGKPNLVVQLPERIWIHQIGRRCEYQCARIKSVLSECWYVVSILRFPQTCQQTTPLSLPLSLLCFVTTSSEVMWSKLRIKEEKKGGKAVTLMFLLQFFIEAGLRGQVLRKTSLCGEKCTGNKPKWHGEVQLSTMINGTYASWMCLVPLPCWLSLLRAGSRLLGLARSCNLNPSTRGSELTGRRRRSDCQEFWLTMLLLCSFTLRFKCVKIVGKIIFPQGRNSGACCLFRKLRQNIKGEAFFAFLTPFSEMFSTSHTLSWVFLTLVKIDLQYLKLILHQLILKRVNSQA